MRIIRYGFVILYVGWVVFAAGCALGSRIVTAHYKSALVWIDRPEATKERYGSVITIKKEADNKYIYEDGLFSVIFYVTASRINFALTNKTQHSIKTIWDEAAFIDVDGEAGRVAHEGVKYADRNASQPPSIVPAGRSLTDFVLPTNRVYYREGYYSIYVNIPGGWEELPLVLPASQRIASRDHNAVNEFASKVQKNKGKRFGLLLPLEINGIVNEYTFWFEVQEVSVNQ
ncbi:MAG: hypothetical protein GXP49_06555 [Deltaproteobacteria bacterium]|nr:hypothetical protein [Deltaproteobacteria bacterium]